MPTRVRRCCTKYDELGLAFARSYLFTQDLLSKSLAFFGFDYMIADAATRYMYAISMASAPACSLSTLRAYGADAVYTVPRAPLVLTINRKLDW